MPSGEVGFGKEATCKRLKEPIFWRSQGKRQTGRLSTLEDGFVFPAQSFSKEKYTGTQTYGRQTTSVGCSPPVPIPETVTSS